MAELTELIEYLKKLQRIVDMEDVFSFLGISFIKKTRVDDILCCIQATLPPIFKSKAKTMESAKRYKSAVCYNELCSMLTQPFLLDKNLYVYRKFEVISCIKVVMSTIENDICLMEAGK